MTATSAADGAAADGQDEPCAGGRSASRAQRLGFSLHRYRRSLLRGGCGCNRRRGRAPNSVNLVEDRDGNESLVQRTSRGCIAHLLQGNHSAAVDTFRSAYAADNPHSLPAMPWILEIVADLVGSGVPAHEIVEILEGDKTKSDALAPLVVALRQLGGDEVRASTEVLEVAVDVRGRIESRQASDPPVDSQLPSTSGDGAQ